MRTKQEFLDVVHHYMEHIQYFYDKFADKRPVMELALPSKKIYAYPYTEYLKDLSPRSQGMLKRDYQAAIKKNRMVVFVRDNDECVLKSGTFPIDPPKWVRDARS